ncbi:MAG: hypothetical protein LH473_03020 [Chitinophagales bacterium]|nr:hypothetical protein [Chitinophagales bacterium]
MLFGRATNNWEAQFNFGDSSEGAITKSINSSLEDNGKCPMSWILDDKKKYNFNYRKSPFWNAIK